MRIIGHILLWFAFVTLGVCTWRLIDLSGDVWWTGFEGTGADHLKLEDVGGNIMFWAVAPWVSAMLACVGVILLWKTKRASE
jgi:hypothetical protein